VFDESEGTVEYGWDRHPRPALLKLATVGLVIVTGALITVPAFAFMIAPAFLKQGMREHDLGPVSHYPVGEFLIATFTADPTQGAVSRRVAFIRNNGSLGDQPSFTILSNRSTTTLGCPVQPGGRVLLTQQTRYKDVTLIPTQASAFGSPCHDAQYDTEGNQTHGPHVRALDRFSFSIRNGNLFIGKPFSVSRVDGTATTAKIHKWTLAFPGERVGGISSWLYPIQPPH
jgi:Rieske Fe-S protein